LILPAYAEESQIRSWGRQGVFWAGLAGVFGAAAFCFWPHPPGNLVWGIPVAALAGIFYGTLARTHRLGKQAIAIGCVNLTIWVAILVAINLPSGKPVYGGQSNFPRGAEKLDNVTTNYPGDWIWEADSERLAQVPPIFLLRPSTLPAGWAPFDMFGDGRYLTRGRTVKELIERVWSQKNSEMKIIFEVELPADKYDFIVTGQRDWPEALEAEINRRFDLTEQIEYRGSDTVVMVKKAGMEAPEPADEMARLKLQIEDNELKIAKRKFQADVRLATNDGSVSNIVALMQKSYATVWNYRDTGWTVSQYGGDIWTNQFSEVLDRMRRYHIEVVTAQHPFSQTNRWWSDGATESWQQGDYKPYQDAHPASEGGELSLVNNDSIVPAQFYNLNWGNILATMAHSSATELVRRKDESINGVDCYVLERTNIGLTVWVGKQDYLIRRYRNFISKERAAEARKHSPNTNSPVATADIVNIETHANVVINEPLPEDAFKPATATIENGSDDDLTLAKQPPVVVETFPLSGARDVAPGEVAIRVRFSKPMMDGSWSWSTAWENSTPDFIGTPHYESDACTCVAKAKLEPGHAYAFWLNSEKFLNFKDSEGRPAIPYLLIFQTRQQ
jgi:hypothetical protein